MNNSNKVKNNPFEALSITIKPKALFQANSNEANQIEINERITALAKIIFARYNLIEVVKYYLLDNDVKTYKVRKNEIVSSFNLYTRTILEQTIKKGSCSSSIVKNLTDSFYKEDNEPKKLHDAINTFIIAINELFSIRDLLIAYFENSQEYLALSSVLGVDLEEDIIRQLLVKDEKENTQPQWKYVDLYYWFKNVLIPDIRNNKVSYWLPSLQMPTTQISNVFIKRFLPIEDQEPLKENPILRKKRLYEFAEKIIRVLWLNEPLFEEPVYLVRCNYTEKSASEIEYLYENNIVSICIQEEETIHQNYFDELMQGHNPAYNKRLPYIKRFVSLVDLVKEKDIIVIASYHGKKPKIGLIKRGSELFCKKGNGFNLFCLKMKSVYCTPNWGEQFDSIDLRSYPILKSIIPQQVTLSAVNQRRNAVYGIFYGAKYPLSLSLMTDSAIETMCTEWLRSRFANESNRICYQIISTGGNFADIDILGANSENKIVAAQVSNTSDINLVCKKIEKLKAFNADEKIMFSNVSHAYLKSIDDCQNIFIGEVWSELFSNSFYKVMIERLITL